MSCKFNTGSSTCLCCMYRSVDDRLNAFAIRSVTLYATGDRAIAQAVRCQFPTAVAWVWSQVRSCGICSGQRGTGADFLKVLILPNAPYTSIIRGWYNRTISGWHTKWTQSHPTPQIVCYRVVGWFIWHLPACDLSNCFADWWSVCHVI
jgi:hypothetical protein